MPKVGVCNARGGHGPTAAGGTARPERDNALSTCSCSPTLHHVDRVAGVQRLPGGSREYRLLRQESAEVCDRRTILAPRCDWNRHRRLQGWRGAVVTVAGVISVQRARVRSSLYRRHQRTVRRAGLTGSECLHLLVLVLSRRGWTGWLLLVFPRFSPAQPRATACRG